MGTLTVRENLLFSANLRLNHDKFTEAERKKKVDDVIEQLNLQSCADTPVSDGRISVTSCKRFSKTVYYFCR